MLLTTIVILFWVLSSVALTVIFGIINSRDEERKKLLNDALALPKDYEWDGLGNPVKKKRTRDTVIQSQLSLSIPPFLGKTSWLSTPPKSQLSKTSSPLPLLPCPRWVRTWTEKNTPMTSRRHSQTRAVAFAPQRQRHREKPLRWQQS